MNERANMVVTAASDQALVDQLKLAVQVSLAFQQKLNHMKQDLNELVEYKKKVEAVNTKYQDIHQEGSSLCNWINNIASAYLPQDTAPLICDTSAKDQPEAPATQESKSSSMSQFRTESRSTSLSSNSVFSDDDNGYYSTNVPREPNQSIDQENRSQANEPVTNVPYCQQNDSGVEGISSQLADMPVFDQSNLEFPPIEDNGEIYFQEELQASQISIYEDACDQENDENDQSSKRWSPFKKTGRLESSLIKINEDDIKLEAQEPSVIQLITPKNEPSEDFTTSMQSEIILSSSSSDEVDKAKHNPRFSSQTTGHSWYNKLDKFSPKVNQASSSIHRKDSSEDEFILSNLDSSSSSSDSAESTVELPDLLSDHDDKWPRQKYIGIKKEKKEPDNEWMIELNQGKNFKQLTKDTIKARKSEDSRKKRIENKRRLEAKALGLSYEALMKANSDDTRPRQPGEVYLDVDLVSGKLTLPVDSSISRHLLQHQVQGVKFMFDACFESLFMIAKGDPGSGCILAHCMGLGKTIQVVALIHTLLRNSTQTGVKRIMILLPTNVLLNWNVEIKKWTERCPYQIRTYQLPTYSNNGLAKARLSVLKSWFNEGGVLLLGYQMFTNLVKCTIASNKPHKEEFHKYLLNPGADLLICDEGHVLKNMDTMLNKAVAQINTPRRIVLTGTPLQNNLIEYYCMVSLVKPNLLGTIEEYRNQFVNPIENGQTKDASPADVVYMKHRAHVLHFILNHCVQRKDMDLIKKLLPEKKEYVLSVKLSELQTRLYKIYLGEFVGDLNSAEKFNRNLGGMLFKDFQELFRIWNHPCILKVYKEKYAKQRITDTDDIDDDSLIDDSPCDKPKPRGPKVKIEPTENKELWWEPYIKQGTKFDPSAGGKLIILGKIIELCKQMNDKLLIFSQSLLSLDLVEEYLKYRQVHHREEWTHGQDYFRIDGSVNVKSRDAYINKFNKPGNSQARLFLISTKAGGVGVNLVAANRCVIFDVCWNPAYDVQSMFRLYRFGQTKKVYVYRLIAHGTMEEKIYRRQIAKQSLSKRVIDEHQLERHFTQQELRELYKLEPAPSGYMIHLLPNDDLLKEVLIQCHHWMVKYHEHHSLLENRTDEYLTEAEKNAAWEEYEKERKKTYSYFDQDSILATPKASDDITINKTYTVSGSSKVSLF